MLRVIPFAAVQFVAHEQFKILLNPLPTTTALPAGRRFIAGSLAGCTATLTTYPLDVARARMAVTGNDKYVDYINNVLLYYVIIMLQVS